MPSIQTDTELQELVADVASDFSLVQGLGGNVSFKHDGTLFVKSSGRRLGEIDSEGYFVDIPLGLSPSATSAEAARKRPSIELPLHLTLPEKYVLHLHSVHAIAWAMINGARHDFGSAAVKKFGFAWIPYARPGEDLNRMIQRSRKFSGATSFLLANHGLLVSGSTVAQIKDNLFRMLEFLKNSVEPTKQTTYSPSYPNQRLGTDTKARALWHGSRNWCFSPDQVVFLGSKMPQQLGKGLAEANKVGDLWDLRMRGKALTNVQAEQLLNFVNLSQILPLVSLPTLSEDAALELQEWEAEKARVLISRQDQ